MYPRVILHNMVSVDGRVDGFEADTGLFYELAGQWQADAMLAGSDTMLAAYEGVTADEGVGLDAPEEEPGGGRALLVVPDSRGRLRHWCRMKSEPWWRDVMALCSRTTPRAYLEYLRERDVDYVVAGEDHVDFRVALAELSARYGIETVQVDSGGTLNGVLLRAGLVDEVSVIVSPSLVGGTDARSIYRAPELTSPEGVIRLKLVHVDRVRGGSVWLRYEVAR
jgi:2,5-diamino-6-(ribosylamino)-4(3H)-pyrimidinone 5'-phosphate reductase